MDDRRRPISRHALASAQFWLRAVRAKVEGDEESGKDEKGQEGEISNDERACIHSDLRLGV